MKARSRKNEKRKVKNEMKKNRGRTNLRHNIIVTQDGKPDKEWLDVLVAMRSFRMLL